MRHQQARAASSAIHGCIMHGSGGVETERSLLMMRQLDLEAP